MQHSASPSPFSRARRFALFAVLVSLVMTTVAVSPVGAGVSASSGSLADRFGFASGGAILWERTPAQQAAEVDAIANSGARWIRFDFNWDTVQHAGPTSWSWSQTDQVMALAQSRGLLVLAVLLYTPPWARQAVCAADHACPPSNPNLFAAFAAAAARRYGSGVAAWEVWNEPNWDPFWAGGVSAAKYVAMLKPTYLAIKAVVPGTTVVTGGLAPYGDLNRTSVDPATALRHPVNYLDAMYAAGARGYFDAVGHHPYAHPFSPESCCIGWNAVLYTQSLHVVMAAHGDGNKKIWGTEAGAPTSGAGSVSESQQADWVNQYVQLWTSWSFTGPLMFFTVLDHGTDPNVPADHFGFMDLNMRPKPAYNVFVSLMRSAAGVGPIAGASGTSPYVKVALPSRAVATTAGGGYYVLGSNGTVEAFGGAPSFGAPRLPNGLARDIAVMPDGGGYAVLDGFGGVHEYGSARGVPVPTGYWPNWNIARSLAITPDGHGMIVQDGYGGIHASGDAPRVLPAYWPGRDLARGVAITPDNQGVYTLDGYGGVHSGGTAKDLGAPYWRGFDIARDIVVTPSGDGYGVLDGFGAVHTFGDAPKTPTPGYNRADVWRGIGPRTS